MLRADLERYRFNAQLTAEPPRAIQRESEGHDRPKEADGDDRSHGADQPVWVPEFGSSCP